MRFKHVLLIAGLVTALGTSAMAQQGSRSTSGTTGAMSTQPAPRNSLPTPTPGSPSNSGFGSSAAGGSAGTQTGPTSPGGGGAVSGMGNTRP